MVWNTVYLSPLVYRRIYYNVAYSQCILPLPCQGNLQCDRQCVCTLPCQKKLCHHLSYSVIVCFLVCKTLLQSGIQCICPLPCPGNLLRCSLSFPGNIVTVWHTVYFSTPLSMRLCCIHQCICLILFPEDLVTPWHTVYLFTLFPGDFARDVAYSVFVPSLV